MTAVTHAIRSAPRQRGLKGLAGALFFVCLVLFLLAIEQKQAVEAWGAVRDEAIPATGRLFDWAAGGAEDGFAGLREAAAGDGGPLTASSEDIVLTGEFAPADDDARQATGAAAFAGAMIRFESGGALRTRPARIAAGREGFVNGQTFAQRLDAPADAQIEIRQVIAPQGAQAVPPSPLCGGQAPGAVALLHRRDRVQLMIFRERTIVGPEARPEALCGVWSYRQR